MKKIILASKSPRRIELLKMITDDFLVIVSDFNEDTIKTTNPILRVKELSFNKAKTVFDSNKNNDVLVIGADTIVCLDNEILVKPKDKGDSFLMLKKLSGQTHKVISGVTVMTLEKVVQFEVVTNVTFYELTDNEILSYIEKCKPFDKAGSYGIQDNGSLFVEKIEGDYYNVVGLPISKLNKILAENFYY